MATRAERLHRRWEGYHDDFMRGDASAETVLAAYTDWVDAVESGRLEIREAREGGKLLARLGIRSSLA